MNKSVRITIAHINDTHSYFEPTLIQLDLKTHNEHIRPFVSTGGFARITTRKNELKKKAALQKRGFLFLHAGDCFQGTLYFSLFKGMANADLLNAIRIDAMTLGNHELDMGNAPVADFLERIEFPLLAGNWDLSQEDKNKPKRLSVKSNIHAFNSKAQRANWITKVIQDEPVAIFGLSLDKMSDISNPDPDTPFINALEVARATIAAIHKEGINKIILLSHLGYEEDKELAGQVDGIGLIIGGHSHRLQGDLSKLGLGKEEAYGVHIKDTYVVQSGCNALALGHCEISFSKDGKVTDFKGKNELLFSRKLHVEATQDLKETGNHDYMPYSPSNDIMQLLYHHPNVAICRKDPQIHQLLWSKYIPKVRALQKQIIAHNQYARRHVRLPKDIKQGKGGSDLAPFIARSFYYMLNKQGILVDFAIHNAGGVRSSLNSGKVTVADITGNILPFAVSIGVYHVNGATLRLIIEGAINNALNNGIEGTGTGSYPYAHHLSFTYISDAPLGQRVENLLWFNGDDWEKVEEDRIYVGTSSAYTMKGKEGYNAILQQVSPPFISPYSMSECFIEFLQDNPDVLL
ncbi:bifunctional metallophosphatase/5'-nucleotidase [Vibrio sp.]|nr:bifunctional metallophosphatase/5'-nucleotidase [Vibrio sp.]